MKRLPLPRPFSRSARPPFNVSARGLALYRIAFAVFALLAAAPGHHPYFRFTPLADIPDVFFLPPPGPMQFLSGFPPEVFFEALHIGIVTALVALLLGYRTRLASVATTVLMLVGFGFSYSLGKINHNILFVLLPLLMAGSGWGAAWSLDARRTRERPRVSSWPLVLTATVTSFAMCTAGFPKVLGGWLDPSTQAARSRLLDGFFVKERQDFLAEAAVSMQNDVIWELLDIATVAFEMGFLLALLYPAVFRIFAAGAVFFHAGVMLIMNIAFPLNFIVYAVALPWPRIARRIVRRVARVSGRRRLRRVHLPTWTFAVFGTGLVAFFYLVGSPLLWVDGGFTSDLLAIHVFVVGLGIATVVAVTVPVVRRGLATIATPRSS